MLKVTIFWAVTSAIFLCAIIWAGPGGYYEHNWRTWWAKRPRWRE